MLGQRLQGRVPGRGAAGSGCPEDARGRHAQDERRQVEIPGELVQRGGLLGDVPACVPAAAVVVAAVVVAAVVVAAVPVAVPVQWLGRDVDDGGQRMLRRHPVQQLGQRVPIGGVTGHRGDPDPGAGDLTGEVGQARDRVASGAVLRVVTGPGQHQVPGTTGGEPPRGMTGQAGRVTRDQHGALR